MKKTIILIGVLSLLVVISSCNMFSPSSNNNSAPKVRTDVNIVDPYGNKLFVEGTINNSPIRADKNGVYIEAKINAVEKYSFSEPILDLFSVSSVDFDGKSVNITLRKKDVKAVGLFRSADGNLMFYAYGYGDTPYFQIWLKDRLSWSAQVGLNNEQILLAGGWLIGVGKNSDKIRLSTTLNRSPNEIYAKLNIPTSVVPRIEKVEVFSTK